MEAQKQIVGILGVLCAIVSTIVAVLVKKEIMERDLANYMITTLNKVTGADKLEGE